MQTSYIMVVPKATAATLLWPRITKRESSRAWRGPRLRRSLASQHTHTRANRNVPCLAATTDCRRRRATPSSCVTMSVSGCDCDPRIGKILWSNARNPITGFARAQSDSDYPRDTTEGRGRTWGHRDGGRATAWADGALWRGDNGAHDMVGVKHVVF